MPKAEYRENYTHKQLKASIKAEIKRVAPKASEAFVIEPAKVLRIYFTTVTNFSTWWNKHVTNDYAYDRKAYVAFVASMCEVYRISRKAKEQTEPELFTEQKAA